MVNVTRVLIVYYKLLRRESDFRHKKTQVGRAACPPLLKEREAITIPTKTKSAMECCS